MACQTFFFFFFFQEKQATENGILQIYKHGENGLNALRMAWLCGEPLCAPEAGACPPSHAAWFSARGPAAQVGQSAGPRPSVLRPLPSDGLAGGRLRSPFCTEPPAVGRFPGRRSVACSNNKLVAIKADAVFS